MSTGAPALLAEAGSGVSIDCIEVEYDRGDSITRRIVSRMIMQEIRESRLLLDGGYSLQRGS